MSARSWGLPEACLFAIRSGLEDECRDSAVFGTHSVHPRGIELQTVDGCDHVDPNRLDANLERDARTREVVLCHVSGRRSEGLQRRDQTLRVGAVSSDPDIQIFRGTNESVRGQRVRTDYEKLNPVLVEYGQQIFEVLVQQRASSLARPASTPKPLPCAPPAFVGRRRLLRLGTPRHERNG